MIGSESKLLSMMEGADRKFIIPVYQRKYDWKKENCERLHDNVCSRELRYIKYL